MSLTDRMAAALRRVVWSTWQEDHQEAADVLAEYDASCAAPVAKALPQKGQRVRSKQDPDNPMWQGEVIKVTGEFVHYIADSGMSLSAMATSLEVMPNLPATNTGD